MATKRLEAEFILNVTQAQAAGESVVTLLKKVGDQTKQIGAVQVPTAHLQNFNQILSGTNKGMDTGKGATDKYASAQNSARTALQQFTWMLSDTPSFLMNFRMGMMAIGNNLDMVVRGLVLAREEAKSTGTTLGASIVGALKGPGGAIMGLTVLMTLLQALPFVMKALESESDKLAEGGLKKFGERLKNLSDESVTLDLHRTRQEIASLNKATGQREATLGTGELTALAGTAEGGMGGSPIGAGAVGKHGREAQALREDQARIVELKEREKLLQQEVNDRMARARSLIEIMNLDYQSLVAKRDHESKTVEEYRTNNEAIVRFEQQRKDLLMTTEERAGQIAKMTQVQHAMGMASIDDVRTALEHQRAVTLDKEKQLDIEKQLHDLAVQEADLEAKRQDVRNKAGEAGAKAEADLWKYGVETSDQLIKNEFDRKQAAETRRHTEQLADLDQQARQAGMYDYLSGQYISDAKTAVDAENALHETNNIRIAKDRLASQQEMDQRLAEMRANSITNDLQREYALADARAQADAAQARHTFTDKDQLNQALDAIELQRLQKRQQAYERFSLDAQLTFDAMETLGRTGANAIGNYFTQAMNRAFGTTNDLFAQMIGQMVTTMITRFADQAIAKMMASLFEGAGAGGQAVKPGGGEGPSPFSLLSFLAMIPFLAEGGIARRPTLAMIGESGPEAIVPLDRRAPIAALGAAGGLNVNVQLKGEASVGLSDLRFALKRIDDLERRLS